MTTEGPVTPERIVPTYAQVVAAAEAPGGDGAPAARTIGEIAEQVLYEAGFAFNPRAGHRYESEGEKLAKQVDVDRVAALLDEAVENGDLVLRRAAVSGRGSRKLVYVSRDHARAESEQQQRFLNEAETLVLDRHHDEVLAEYHRLCDAAGIPRAPEGRKGDLATRIREVTS